MRDKTLGLVGSPAACWINRWSSESKIAGSIPAKVWSTAKAELREADATRESTRNAGDSVTERLREWTRNPLALRIGAAIATIELCGPRILGAGLEPTISPLGGGALSIKPREQLWESWREATQGLRGTPLAGLEPALLGLEV
jgi:hypothetical protein